MARPATLTPEAIIKAAVAFIDQWGSEAFTLRALGIELGVHHTALFRYFPTKEDLIQEIFEYVIANTRQELQYVPDEPMERVRGVAVSLRKVLHDHPGLIMAIAATTGSPSSLATQRAVLADLRALGVAEEHLAVRYQALESYIVGTTLYDFTGAPTHLDQRQERYEKLGDVMMAAAFGSTHQVDVNNEKAFTFGLDALLAGILRK